MTILLYFKSYIQMFTHTEIVQNMIFRFTQSVGTPSPTFPRKMYRSIEDQIKANTFFYWKTSAPKNLFLQDKQPTRLFIKMSLKCSEKGSFYSKLQSFLHPKAPYSPEQFFFPKLKNIHKKTSKSVTDNEWDSVLLPTSNGPYGKRWLLVEQNSFRCVRR